MEKQNVFEDGFFRGYTEVIQNKSNTNILMEKSGFMSLIPNLKNKKVLDMGCGYGENCVEFVKLGAEKVVGIDISKKMIAIAKSKNSRKNIQYINMSKESIGKLQDKFDFIFSSLAINYIEDFEIILKNVSGLLNQKGYFIFSQENHLNPYFTIGNRWTRDQEGNLIYTNILNDDVNGRQLSRWLVNDPVNCHRKFSVIINSLVNAGFAIDNCLEPISDKKSWQEYPKDKRQTYKANFLLIKCHKK